MSITLYAWPMSSASRVEWVLEELGVPFHKVVPDRAKQEHRQAAFLAINPNGKIPALTDGDAKLFESLAIVLYLAERYGHEKGLWPAPATAARAEAMTWTTWGTVEVMANAVTYIMNGTDAHFAYAKDKRNADAAAHAKRTWHEQLAVLDKRLADHGGFTVGGAPTLADFANVSSIGAAQMLGGLDTGGFPHVGAWMSACMSRPAARKVFAGR